MMNAMMSRKMSSPMADALGRMIPAMPAAVSPSAVSSTTVSSTAVPASCNRRQAGKAQHYENGPP